MSVYSELSNKELIEAVQKTFEDPSPNLLEVFALIEEVTSGILCWSSEAEPGDLEATRQVLEIAFGEKVESVVVVEADSIVPQPSWMTDVVYGQMESDESAYQKTFCKTIISHIFD